MKTLGSSSLPVAKAPRKPVVVRVAGVESRIYANAVRVYGKVYGSFLVKFPDRALVTEAEGKAWFGLLPALTAAGADVVPMPRAGKFRAGT